MRKKISTTSKVIGVITFAALSFYGGQRYEQYKEAKAPHRVMEIEGKHIYVDIERKTGMFADEIVPMYNELQELKKKAKEGPLEEITK